MRTSTILISSAALLASSQVLALPATSASIASSSTSPESTLAPLAIAEPATRVEDNYIVVLKQGVDVSSLQAHLSVVEGAHLVDPLFAIAATSDGSLTEVATGGISKIYQPTTVGHKGFYGYAGAFTPSTLEVIRSQPEVDYVEHDQIVSVDPGLPSTPPTTASINAISTGGSHSFRASELEVSTIGAPNITHQSSAPWGLARISHRPHLSFGTFTRYDYSTAGLAEGVDVYVIDTGINIEHIEFEGRAKWGKTIPKDASDYDGNGHGSHCAGTIGSRKYGVAKGVNIYAVKVLGDGGSGTFSDVLSGIQWAADQASIKQAAAQAEFAATGKTSYKGSVGSMSLGGPKSRSTDDAVNAATEFLTMVVAAGNDNKDACNYSPASASKAITIGASTLSDERAYFSNFGTCVDIFAPGLNILSTWTNGNATTNTISGTSMATPHMAGLIAYVLSIYGTETLPFMTKEQLTALEILGDDSGKDAADAAIAAFTTPVTDISARSLVYANVYSLMPRLVQKVMPVPAMLAVEDAAKPDTTIRTLTPPQIKGLLKTLASKNVLTNVGEGSPNLLAFNNATIPPPAKK